MNRRKYTCNDICGFTFVEMLIVLFITMMIVFAAYKVFFQQTRMVRQSLEEIKVNDDFRKILAFMGNDVRESTRIDEPAPVNLEDARGLSTKPGMLMRIAKEEQNPTLEREGGLGQIAVKRTIVYELENNPNPLEPSIPRYRLIRNESVEEHGRSDDSLTQRHVICDDVRDLVVFRTIRKPLPPHNVDAIGDRLLQPQPASISGTGNDVVHLRVTLERTRIGEVNGVYRFPMQTCFYKRGKEIWKHP